MAGRLKESVVEKQILYYLNFTKIGFFFKVKTTGTFDAKKSVYRPLSGYSLKGVSDIIGLLPTGQMVAIEVKSSVGKPTDEQLAFLARIEMMGGIGIWANSIEMLKDKLGEYIEFEICQDDELSAQDC